MYHDVYYLSIADLVDYICQYQHVYDLPMADFLGYMSELGCLLHIW